MAHGQMTPAVAVQPLSPPNLLPLTVERSVFSPGSWTVPLAYPIASNQIGWDVLFYDTTGNSYGRRKAWTDDTFTPATPLRNGVNIAVIRAKMMDGSVVIVDTNRINVNLVDRYKLLVEAEPGTRYLIWASYRPFGTNWFPPTCEIYRTNIASGQTNIYIAEFPASVPPLPQVFFRAQAVQ